MHELIINKPEALKTHHKVTYVGVTFIFWLIIFYLWQPFISLVAWYFGFQFFYDHMIELGGYKEFGSILLLYTQIIAGLGVVFVAWAKVNEWRFKGKDRRKEGALVTHQEVAKHFKIDSNQLSTLINSKNIALDITDDMEIMVTTTWQEQESTDLTTNAPAIHDPTTKSLDKKKERLAVS